MCGPGWPRPRRPAAIARRPERAVRIPMRPGARCLNLSNAVAVVVYEVLRQRDLSGLQEQGKLVR